MGTAHFDRRIVHSRYIEPTRHWRSARDLLLFDLVDGRRHSRAAKEGDAP